MNIPISKQVSATYARNHFKEINDKALREGMCVIVRGSKPSTVILSMAEFHKLKNGHTQPKKKKITLEELRKNSIFSKYVGTMEEQLVAKYGNIPTKEMTKKWTDYVD